MSKTVDERVVSMQFDNAQFERNVGTSMSTIEKLKQSLNFKGMSKGLDEVSDSANKMNFSGLSNGIETVKAKFSALQVMAVTALSNITNSALNAGKRLVSAFTIDPIKQGFQEYETQINAVQTILANTSSKGTTLKDVNAALDELNTYADKTIYNFTEMTRNIGTFTAAGVDLKTSTTAIQGIANLAAVSGSTSQQASTAMYQLSQALSSGTVKLQDWNSVVNAGMGGQVFQDALKKTAETHGVNVDAMIKKNGSFRESLQEGWITSEILTETLGKMTQSGAAEYLSKLTGISQKQIEATQKEVDANKDGKASYDKLAEAMAKTGKVSKQDALDILKMADTATNAATKVKTFTQLMDTLKEAAQSGWTQTWEYIIGDFEQAKGLWTNVSDTLGDIINRSSEARNKVMKGWSEGGGRDDLIASLENVFNGLLSVIKPIKEAFSEIFPPITVNQLLKFTEGLKNFTSHLILSDERADKLKRTFKGVFAVFDMFKKILGTIGGAIAKAFGSDGASSIFDSILSGAAKLGDALVKLNENFNTDGIKETLSKGIEKVSGFITNAIDKLGGFKEVLSTIWKFVSNVAGKIGDGLKAAFSWITENVSMGDVFAGLVGGGVFAAAQKFSGLIDKIKETIEKLFEKKEGGGGLSDIKDMFKDVLGSVKESLQAFTAGIKIGSLVAIAIAIGILSASLKTIAKLKMADLSKGLFAIGTMLTMLSLGFKSLMKSLKKYDSKGIVKSAFSLILIAVAIKILASALEQIGKLSMAEIAKGLVGIGGGLLELVLALKAIDKVKISLKTSIAMIALAVACKILGDAMAKFAGFSWEEIGRGLTAMGGALVEFVVALNLLHKLKIPLKTTIAMIVLAESCKILAEALQSFASMSWSEIGRGLVGMGGALLELTLCLKLMHKLKIPLKTTIALLVMSLSLGKIAEALQIVGSMSWGEVARGLVGLGGAFTEMALVAGLLGKLGGTSSIIGAGVIMLMTTTLPPITDALQKIGSMSWGEVARGLVGLGGALLEIGVITGALGYLAGFSGLLGAASLWVAIQGLQDLATAFQKFGSMSWSEIARGLVGMGGAILEVEGITAGIGSLAGLAGLVGAASLWVAVQGLQDLATAFQSFGSMSWEEIGRGLVAMGGAILEVEGITAGIGAISGLAGLVGAASLWTAVQGLGDLADALKKFASMSWDEIGRGLAAMGSAMGEVALGGFLNTLSGLGAASIAEIAKPLGDLADSVKKWSGVTVPEGLGAQLGILADGVMKFTFGGMGASALAESATPLGTMADSVKKWSGVTIPKGLGGQLGTLADGIKKFTFGGMGASALAESATPLGTMADSVKKWSGVTVPKTLGSDLTKLSDGIKTFSFAFMGGWSLSTITEPLGKLADSVNKWKNVSIPKNLGGDLKKLSDGVLAFSFAFIGGWSLSAVTGPLGKLAESVSKWKGISIPSNLGTQLSSLATGVKSFSGISDISTSVNGLKTIANAVSSMSKINFSGLGTNISSFAKTIGGLSDAGASLKTFASSLNSGASQMVAAGKKLSSSVITGVKSNQNALASAGKSIVTGLAKGVNSGKASLNSVIKPLVTSTLNAFKSQQGTFSTTGKLLMTRFAAGVKSGSSSATSAFSSALKTGVSSARAYYGSFYSAGSYVAQGFASGISANSWRGEMAAKAMAKAAYNAAKDALKINSPSKVFRALAGSVPEGFAQGIDRGVGIVKSSAVDMANTAINNTKKAISKIADYINGDIDSQPTIRPVLDLSDVASGARSISGLLDVNPSIGVLSNVKTISSMMNKRQNGANNDDVVFAIKDLGKAISDYSGDTYNVNGVSYSDDASVSEAIQTLVRAARIERRS